MSTLLLIIKKDGKTIVVNEHYRKIKEILARLLDGSEVIANDIGGEDFPRVVVDSGLIIINFDSSTILSCQNAFGLHNLDSGTRRIIERRWEFIEYPEFVE